MKELRVIFYYLFIIVCVAFIFVSKQVATDVYYVYQKSENLTGKMNVLYNGQFLSELKNAKILN